MRVRLLGEAVVDRVHLAQRAHRPPALGEDAQHGRVGGELQKHLARLEGMRHRAFGTRAEALPGARLEPAAAVLAQLHPAPLGHLRRPAHLEAPLGGVGVLALEASHGRVGPSISELVDQLALARHHHELHAGLDEARRLDGARRRQRLALGNQLERGVLEREAEGGGRGRVEAGQVVGELGEGDALGLALAREGERHRAPNGFWNTIAANVLLEHNHGSCSMRNFRSHHEDARCDPPRPRGRRRAGITIGRGRHERRGHRGPSQRVR